MPKITIEVPPDVWDSLSRLGQPSERAPILAQAALREWAQWLRGTARPMSVSELEMDRLYTIYEQVLVDELPSVDSLARVLDLPMGRARYIMQSLAYRHGRFLNERRYRSVIRALQQGQWSKDKETVTVTVDRSCQVLMDRTMADLVASQRLKTSATGEPTSSGVRYKLGSNHHKELLAELPAILKELDKGG